MNLPAHASEVLISDEASAEEIVIPVNTHRPNSSRNN